MIVVNSQVGHWVAEQMNAVYSPEQGPAIGFERHGQIIAGVFYENYNGRSMMAHIAIQGRASAEFYRFNVEYAFHRCGVHKLIAAVSSGNLKSCRVVEKMGFVEECRIREADPQGDIVIYTLTAEHCRFLKGRYRGQALAATLA